MNEVLLKSLPVEAKNDAFSVRLERLAGIEEGVVVHLQGYVDTIHVPQLRKLFTSILKSGFRRVILDCARTTYLASSPVADLVNFLKECRQLEGELVILRPQPKVREILALLGLLRFLNVQESLEDALACFKPRYGQAISFPRVFACPICRKKLRARQDGRFRCSECKTILHLDAAGGVHLDLESDALIPAKIDSALGLLTELARLAQTGEMSDGNKRAFDRMLNQIVRNIYQREVKDVWAELQETAN